ncbi:MAG TPA: HEXXH motif-containing putative peptide modification protein [Patescibacteria group bacterium]|nr:HEXXH motif-containing putative peptide modification protein [Patescibacteria group bacterium]
MPVVRSALMDSLAPPEADASRRLRRAVARRTARRLRRLGRRLGSIPPARRLRRLTREVEGLLGDLPAESRRTLLHGPDLRGFLSEAETWTGIAALARVAARRPRPRTTTPWNRLFERISRTDQLVVLVPGGRVDAALPRRALRLARERLAALEGDLGALLLGARLAFGSARENGAGPVRLRAAADPEQGRPSHRIDLGTFIGAAGSLGLEVGRGRGIPAPRVMTATLRRGTLRLDGPRGGAVFPAAASPLRFPAGAAAGPARLVRRRLVPGTAILLAPALRSSPRRLVVGADLSGLDARLAGALRLIRLSWPAAHREVLARTAMVVPVRESGLVSYSLAARPGVSFINVSGKSAVALADDLLHETAHHLLHDLQEVTRLLRRGPDTEETQAFDSPWRGTRRPLHGILHGAYTFLFRAELFARLLDARRRMPRVLGTLLGGGEAAFLARELRRELTLCSRALRDLAVAARAGLLTPDGRALVRALAAWRRRIASRTA